MNTDIVTHDTDWFIKIIGIDDFQFDILECPGDNQAEWCFSISVYMTRNLFMQ